MTQPTDADRHDNFDVMDSHERIWLEPQCAADGYEGRTWAQNDAWGKCEECQSPAVEYVRADLLTAARSPAMSDEAIEREKRQRARFCIRVLCGMAVITVLVLGATMVVTEHYGPFSGCFGFPYYRCR